MTRGSKWPRARPCKPRARRAAARFLMLKYYSTVYSTNMRNIIHSYPLFWLSYSPCILLHAPLHSRTRPLDSHAISTCANNNFQECYAFTWRALFWKMCFFWKTRSCVLAFHDPFTHRTRLKEEWKRNIFLLAFRNNGVTTICCLCVCNDRHWF